MFKIAHDPRHTRFGYLLSRSGLDELPQLINILKGEMSFIGPRPLPLYEAKKLPKSWDFRYSVKPGIVSEWAISPQRYQSLRTWKKLEEKTLQKGSLKEDLLLLFKTIQYLFGSFFRT